MSDTRTDIITNDVFISWTGKDKAIKDAVKAHLEDKGLTCTDSQIDCAGNYFEWSKQAATASHIAVLILTENSIKSSTYQKTELQEIVKAFGENFSNRLVTFCPNQAVYDLETFGENGESLLADNYNSAVFFGEEVTREALEDLATKVTNLLLGRTFEIYKAACEASEKKMGLLSFFVDRQQGNTSVDYDKIYVERNVKGGGGNELSAKELLASGDLLLVYGPSGMGKTEYIKQLRRAAAPEVLTVVVRCSDLWRSGKTVYGYLCENVAKGVQNAAFTDKHFERLWSGRDRLVVFDGLDEVPTTATTDLFFQKIGEFCQAKADGRRTQLIFTSRNKDDAKRFADDSTDVKSRLRSFELQPLNDNQIEKLCASLAQVFGFDGDDFFYKIKRLDKEIKTNPLLVSQLAIIFKNDGSIPYDSMEMTEKLAEIVFGVEDRAKVLDVKGAEITNLRALVEAFAALQYEKPELEDAVVMRIALKQRDERAVPKHVLEYFKKRAIYVDGRFLHKSLGEFFAASEFAWRYQSEDTPQTVLDLVISHCGDDSWGSIVNWFVRKTKLKTLVIPEGVKRIGGSEFYKCDTLTSVTISSSVTSIGSGAFFGCDQAIKIDGDVGYVDKWAIRCDKAFRGNIILREDTIGIGNWAFSGCSGVASITILDSVTSIGEYAFFGCSGLTSIIIPDSVTSIGYHAFDGCRGLTSVMIPYNVTNIGSGAFAGCNNMTSIIVEDGNFVYHSVNNCLIGTKNKTLIAGCKTSVIPDDGRVTSIGDWAFDGCSGLASITIPDSVTSIGISAFEGCGGLKSIMIPDSVTSIGDLAFQSCSGLTSITIPDSVSSLGWGAFSGCSGLTSITIPDSVTSIGEEAFSGCSSLTSVTIGNGVAIIGEKAFYECGGLTSVTIGNSVTSIGGGAFFFCSKLTEVYYQGDLSGWLEIEFADSSANPMDKTKNVYINGQLLQGDIVIPGGTGKIGDCTFCNCSGLTSVTIPDSVTSIGEYAFAGCSGLTSITIPDSVTSIGDRAFDRCGGLTSIVVEDGNPVYHSVNNCFIEIKNKTLIAGCKTSVIPDDGRVTSIGEYAFYECSGLTSITIPDSVTSIGDRAFDGCSGLTNITIPDSMTSIGDWAFAGCSGLTSVTIGTSVTSIRCGAFYGCGGLTEVYYQGDLSGWLEIEFGVFDANPMCCAKNLHINGQLLQGDIVIPEGTGKIGDCTFRNCSGLTSVTIPDSVTSIGDWAFDKCSGLTNITIPDSMTSIGSSAFSGCSGLTSITIPDSVTSIGNYAFSACSGLTSIVVEDGNPVYHSVDNCLIETKNKTLIAGCKTSVIPDDGSVTSIGNLAFFGCSGLTSIVIPDSVTSIGQETFRNCSGLTYITIPDSVTNISKWTFSDCSGLTSVTIPDSVTRIGYRAFAGCSGLTSITIPGSVTGIGREVFHGCRSLKDVYYKGDVNAWLMIFNSDSYLMNYADNLHIAGMPSSGMITINNKRTMIPSQAFRGLKALKSVTIPYNVTNIGSGAFAGCNNMTSIIVEDGNPVYHSVNNCLIETKNKTLIAGCKTSVIPDDGRVTSIGDWAFRNCSDLASITIPDSVTSIGSSAFSGCSGLTSITIPDSMTSIGDWAFDGCSGLTSVTIPSSVSSVGKWAFYGCCSLTDITYHGTMIQWRAIKKSGAWGGSDIPDCKVYCKDCVLSYVSNGILTSVTIPNSVTSIDDWAFLTCSGLTSITIPDSVTSVGKGAFSGCSGLTSVTIPDSVTRVGDYAFYNCSSLTSVTYSGTMSQWRTIKKGDYWDEDVPVYKVHCADGVLIKNGNHFDEVPQVQVFGEERGDAENRSNAGLASDALRRDNAMTVIDDYAYARRSDFTSIAIPDNVSSIGKKAFFACGLLMDGTIGEGVVSIGKKAFAWCINLRKITIGGNVSSIGKRAFKRCRSLTTITYHGTMSQWRAIEKASDWDKGTPDYKVHCTDGVLDKDDERNI